MNRIYLVEKEDYLGNLQVLGAYTTEEFAMQALKVYSKYYKSTHNCHVKFMLVNQIKDEVLEVYLEKGGDV